MLTKIEIEALEDVIGIHRELRKANERGIDWEQRRYEAAKDIFCALLKNETLLRDAAVNSHTMILAQCAVEFSEFLITALKKKSE